MKPGRESSALNSTAPPSAGNANPSETPGSGSASVATTIPRPTVPDASMPSTRWMPVKQAAGPVAHVERQRSLARAGLLLGVGADVLLDQRRDRRLADVASR